MATTRHRPGTSKKAAPAKAARGDAAGAIGTTQDRPRPTREHAFPIVGIGASAGGIEAFKALLAATPADTGMAFVFILHLAPTHVSMLAQILGRETDMPVAEVQDEPEILPNRVYVIPPGRAMIIRDGRLHLICEPEPPRHPVDTFFSSLADDCGYRAIGVVLSGTATDGTLGLAAIKAVGGITFAQDESAQHDGMPRSAIASGCVDFVLPPRGIAAELERLARHPYIAVSPDVGAEREDVEPILEHVRQHSGVDFGQYKPNTLHRRIRRRMALHKLSTFKQYAEYLKLHPTEAEQLCQDILISVTSFFRNPEAFEALKSEVLPRIFKDRSRQDPVRVWVLGCSSGEESYSLAIVLAEYIAELRSAAPVALYGTDLNNAAIERARAGFYPKSIADDVSPERLRRFFIEVDGGYRIAKSIRDMCIFARQNVLTDPPFSRMDLVSCRNVMIYMDATLQRKLLLTLHYALKPGGFLFLGPSETIGSSRELFAADDAKHKIYSKCAATLRPEQAFPITAYTPLSLERHGERTVEPSRDASVELQREADRVLLTRYVPAGVLVNGDLDVVQFRGDTGLYLTPAPGKASLNVLKMAREGLLVSLRALLQKAKKGDAPTRESDVRVKSNGGYSRVALSVIPIKRAGSHERWYWVMFEPLYPSSEHPHGQAEAAPLPPERPPRRTPALRDSVLKDKDDQIARLTQELAATREYLQSVIEQQEAANEELQSANEEVQSANEELQSINEELETSKEEIQSSNEELRTVNDELHNRNAELSRLNDDLNNLLSSVDIAIVMVWQDLRIRRFTPLAEKHFNLIASDVGRPIGDIKLNLDVADLPQLLTEAIDNVAIRELEVQDGQGHWYLLRIRPYRTLENRIDGAVIVLIDIQALKADQEALERQGSLLEQARESLQQRVEELASADRRKNEFLALLAHELRNPLAPLRNALHILQRAGAGSDTATHARELIERQVGNMTRIVDDLLDAARIARGQVRLQLQPVDLRTLVQRAAEAVQHQVRERNQRLAVQQPVGPIPLKADPTRLEQVFGNLLTNACKYTPEGGEIRLTVEVPNGAAAGAERDRSVSSRKQAVVRVRDTGVGIEPEMLSRVFDLFTQADSTAGRARGGLGIGLNIVRSLVELHGGSVSAHSEGAGRGSEFVVVLPIDSDSAETAGEMPQPASAEAHAPAADAGTIARGGGAPVEQAGIQNVGVEQAGSPGAQARAAGTGGTPAADGSSPGEQSGGGAVRVLVVDDNPDIAESTSLILSLAGYDVKSVLSGQDAIDVVGSFHPSIVLLDIGMPGLDGYAVARRFRRELGLKDTILIAVSGYGTAADRARTEEAGFDRHLVKPVDPVALQRMLVEVAPAPH